MILPSPVFAFRLGRNENYTQLYARTGKQHFESELNKIKSLRYSAFVFEGFQSDEIHVHPNVDTISSIKPLNCSLNTAITGPSKMKISSRIRSDDKLNEIDEEEDGSRIVRARSIVIQWPKILFIIPPRLGTTPSSSREAWKKTEWFVIRPQH